VDAGSDSDADRVDDADIEGLSLLWRTDDPDEIESIDADALETGHEGIMLKNPDSTYSPGRRGKHWRKRKPDVETLDCVVTGAEWGEGRRATFLGTFELSVQTGDTLETVGKVATGITDEKLAELTELLEPTLRPKRARRWTSSQRSSSRSATRRSSPRRPTRRGTRFDFRGSWVFAPTRARGCGFARATRTPSAAVSDWSHLSRRPGP